jgi:outer membrane receptor protein involved in Fe transport
LTISPAVDPPIGIYVDGVYNVINAGSNNAMIDMERVEVLKGPQGTLFGRNTIGGAISITTAKPTDHFEYKNQATDLPAPLSYAVFFPGQPLTIGGSVKYNF